MFNLHATSPSVQIYEVEPVLNPLKQLYAFPEFLEIAPAQLDASLTGLVEHQFHVGEDVAGILAYCYFITFLPEFSRLLANCLDESEFLHVSRRKSAVKIIDKRNDRCVPHNLSNLAVAILHKLN